MKTYNNFSELLAANTTPICQHNQQPGTMVLNSASHVNEIGTAHSTTLMSYFASGQSVSSSEFTCNSCQDADTVANTHNMLVSTPLYGIACLFFLPFSS